MIIATGYVYLDPGETDEFLRDVWATYPVAYTNPGCGLIAFCRDDTGSGRVVMIEKWQSREALERHAHTPEVRALGQKWGSRIRDETQIYDVAEAQS